MAVRVANPVGHFIDYQLNILGIRVWEHSCKLIAKSGTEWGTLGPGYDLPMPVPKNADDLKAAVKPLPLTAYQYCSECPGSDLAEMLNKTADFAGALDVAAAEAGVSGRTRPQ